jgi:hypothetical protein
VTGPVCPVCLEVCGFHRIGTYERGGIELFPYREGTVCVARFRCGNGSGTFSMLPYQLVPYHRYTLESMVFALLLWRELCSDEECLRAASGYEAAAALSYKSRVSSSLLYSWLIVCREGLGRRHLALCEWYDLSSIRFGDETTAILEEVYGYCVALCPRGPPRKDALRKAAIQYGMKSGGFLLGVPSQERRRSMR